MCEMNNSCEIKLINLIKKNKIIYDLRVQSLFSKNDAATLKDLAWDDVSEQFNMPRQKCEEMWSKLRERYKNHITKKFIIQNKEENQEQPSLSEHEKNMHFMFKFLGNSKKLDLRREFSKRKNGTGILRKNIKLNLNDYKKKTNQTNCDIQNGDNYLPRVSDPSGCDQYDELIKNIGDDCVQVPVLISDSDCDEEEIQLGVKLSDDRSITAEESLSLPVELDMNNDLSSMEVPLHEIIKDYNFGKELDLDFEYSDEMDGEDQLVVFKEKEQDLAEQYHCQSRNDFTDDEDSEEPYYTALAKVANKLGKFKDRLLLRQAVTTCVMRAVSKSWEPMDATNS